MAHTEVAHEKRRRLGRGLSSLIGDLTPAQIPTADPPREQPGDPAGPPSTPPVRSVDGTADVQSGGGGAGGGPTTNLIDIGLCRPNKYQPRQSMSAESLGRLAASIKQAGVMQPIVVRPSPDGGAGYEIVAGERRWRACQSLGMARIPAVVREIDDEQAAEWALMENVHREDLNAIERAQALESMGRRFGLTQREVAERVGLERSSVANLLRLLCLEEPVREMIAAGGLSAGHGKVLAAMPEGEDRVALARRAQRQGWSVRRLERESIVRSREDQPLNGRAQQGSRRAILGDLERRLGEALGTKVRVSTSSGGKKGRLILEFYSLEHFDDLISRLGVSRCLEEEPVG